MIDRLVFDAVGPFDENLNRLEYWDWLLRFAELCDIAFISKPLADIYVTMWAEASLPNENVPTLKSIRTIANKHLPGFRGRRGIALRQFRSTLFLETAPPMYRKRQPVGAICNVLRSLWAYPLRNAPLLPLFMTFGLVACAGVVFVGKFAFERGAARGKELVVLSKWDIVCVCNKVDRPHIVRQGWIAV